MMIFEVPTGVVADTRGRRTSFLLGTFGLAAAIVGGAQIAGGLLVTHLKRVFQRRTSVLSFDSLMDSSGGVAAQPLLGRAADVWGYPASYSCSAAIQALALPLCWLARKQRAPADAMVDDAA